MRDLLKWWAGPQWRAEATAWICAELTRAGYIVTGEAEQPRTWFWSTQLVVPTDRGRVWFKENNPGQAFEAALVVALRDIAPERVIEPIAVEPDRGWLLSRDHGPTLRALGGGTIEHWTSVLAQFGALQRELETHGPALAAAGLSPVPSTTSRYAASRLTELATLPAGDPARVDRDDLAGLAQAERRLAEAGSELATSGIRDSLQHNDLHDNNAFIGLGEAPLRFFDFGDAVWAHPFAVLMIPRRLIAEALGVEAVHQVVDAYLENWTDVLPLRELRSLVEPAVLLGAVHRSISWRRLLGQVPASNVLDEHRDAESWWLLHALGVD